MKTEPYWDDTLAKNDAAIKKPKPQRGDTLVFYRTKLLLLSAMERRKKNLEVVLKKNIHVLFFRKCYHVLLFIITIEHT